MTTDPRDLIVETANDMRALAGGLYERRMALTITAVADWLAGVAGRHQNTRQRSTPTVSAINKRGYCTGCGGYFGEWCAEITSALALCEAWRTQRTGATT